MEIIRLYKASSKLTPESFRLELNGENGPPMTVIIDPETGLIHRVDGRITMGSREVIMGVVYGDYRRVVDIMLPHRIINYVNGAAIAESLYDSVIVNAGAKMQYNLYRK